MKGIISVQSLSHVQLFVTTCTSPCQASLSITNFQSVLKLLSLELVMPSNHLIFCHPISSCLQSFPESGSLPMSQFFESGGQSISFSISHFNEYSELISFRIDQFDLLVVQGTLKSSPTQRFKSINSSVFSFSAQLLHSYMTIGKTTALTRRTFVGKVMSLILICCLGCP